MLTRFSTQDFLSRDWEDPTDALDRSIKYAAEAKYTAPETMALEWLDTGKEAMTDAALVSSGIVDPDDAQQLPRLKANVQALEDLKTKYAHVLELDEPTAAPQAPVLAEEQIDIGFKIVERGGHDAVQTIKLDTMLFINGNLVGDPGEHSRVNICAPSGNVKDKLIFMTSYLYPEYDYTYISITVARWSGGWNQRLTQKTLGTIEIPMAKCQDNEPQLEVLSKDEAGKLLGVDACSNRVARYTVTGKARFFYDEYAAGLVQNDIPEDLKEIASLINGESEVSVSLLHPIRMDVQDATQEFTYNILESCTEGWLRDGGKPWDVYYAKSRSKRMLDLGTVPKGEAIPYHDQLPARDTFDHIEQYTVRMAVGNQQEKEYHDRHHMKLRDCEVPIRLFPDRRSLHPISNEPQRYFAIVDTSAAGPKVDYLLPRDGDRADFIMLGIFAKNQVMAAPEDMGEIDNEHIAAYIGDTVHEVARDQSIESESAMHEKLHDMLKNVCVRDEAGNEIAANLETLQDKLSEILELAEDRDGLLDFVRSNRTWLTTPPLEIDEDPNPVTEPIRLRGYRVNVPSKLWSPFAHLWKLTVPVNKASGSAKLPLVLKVRDASVDDAGKLLTPETFAELGKSGEANFNIRMEVIDSDKTYKAEMTALKKLSAPHTMPEDDRPSVASLHLFEDLVKAALRDNKPLKELMPDLEKLRRGKHENKHLQRFYKRLSRDKHKAIEYLLDSKKLIKYIHGPPGTGKSYLVLFFACMALMFGPPTDDDNWDRPVDLGRQLQPEEFDEVDQTAPLRSAPLTDAQKAAAPETPRTKILIVSGQNLPVDDLFNRFGPTWSDFGGRKGGKYQPKSVRLHSWKSGSRDFARHFAKFGRYIQHTIDDESTGGILTRLLNGFSDKVDEVDREHRATRKSSYSIVNMAVEVFKQGRENGKYGELSHLIDQVVAQPDKIYLNGKQISHLVQSGPQKDALAQADIVFATPVAVAEKNFRETFRPHYIISDDSPRDKETTTLILLSHFSPRAYIFLGDHKQLAPLVFSTYQHRKYKPPRAFKPADDEQVSCVENLGGDDLAQAENDQRTSSPSQTAAGVTDSEETKPEQTSPAKNGPAEEEESLPNPATFALQLRRPMISRLLGTGLPCVMLTQNFRQHGTVGEFFSGQYYDNKVKFAVADEDSSPVDNAAIEWLLGLSGKEKIAGNSLMIDMKSRENCQARSFSNSGHVNYVLTHVADLLGNPMFRPPKKKPDDGKIMIIVPYEAQKNLYQYELQKRASMEWNSKDTDWVDYPKDQVEIRTHQGAQGHEASVVIIDLVRSDTPGHTGHHDVVNVCSSRAKCAQLVLFNSSVFDRIESKSSPYVESLVAWVQFHNEKDMAIEMNVETA